ncbi:MAG TPA: hypothetical protein VFA66_15035 [Gaiellaceae bacterium]|nr:hypothetical protein [Gaiellaceae bacterium]
MRRRAIVGVAVLGGALFAAIGGAAVPALHVTGVPGANVKAAGYAPASVLSRQLRQAPVAAGAMALENPHGIIGWYGYENDAASPDDPSLPQMVPAAGSTAEAQKTEPDKNTYLVMSGQTGADPDYYYGTHFLFQGHEAGVSAETGRQSYITRINLDADIAHRVTLLAWQDTDGNPIQPIDGSTWDPWAQRLLFTTENRNAPTYAATASYPSTVEDVSGALGRGGYEGIQDDSHGDVWIVEDIGGAIKTGSTAAKQPNSYVYRYVPHTPGDLHNGRLQVLQVYNHAGDPITFESESSFPSPDQIELHTYGNTFHTHWITIHDTAVDGNAPFIANDIAKAHHVGTPFKRPENGQFRPGYDFTQFFFDETGDTNATSSENGNPVTGKGGAGGWGSIMKLTQTNPAADSGQLTLFYACNEAVSGLDNVAFLTQDLVTFVEDAGDTLHTQRKALDSGYVWNVGTSYADGKQPVRWLAEGRDPSATLDSANGGFGTNEGDNEITGVHVSNGNPGPGGILGAQLPALGSGSPMWRWFYTQQHGDNVTWEVTAG